MSHCLINCREHALGPSGSTRPIALLQTGRRVGAAERRRCTARRGPQLPSTASGQLQRIRAGGSLRRRDDHQAAGVVRAAAREQAAIGAGHRRRQRKTPRLLAAACGVEQKVSLAPRPRWQAPSGEPTSYQYSSWRSLQLSGRLAVREFVTSSVQSTRRDQLRTLEMVCHAERLTGLVKCGRRKRSFAS